ncbi:MAG TPA: alpha-amylase family glycosyl hydrolase, partial [Candidatus Saccharimonadia bacterium]|nr:alpha-amylase family glycosyl hydrolase [Candidatus Saccharimonadia bacterium]
VIAAHLVYRNMIRPLDGPGFGSRLEVLTTNYAPDVVAAQLNLLGSHDAPRALTVLGDDVAALRLAFVLQLTLPGAPCVYYGDEIAMTGYDDPDCRRSYPSEPGAGDQALRAFVATVIGARIRHVALRRGGVRVAGAIGDAVVLERTAEGRRALVAVNAGRSSQPVDVAVERGEWQPVPGLVSAGATLSEPNGAPDRLSITLPAQGSAVYVEA